MHKMNATPLQDNSLSGVVGLDYWEQRITNEYGPTQIHIGRPLDFRGGYRVLPSSLTFSMIRGNIERIHMPDAAPAPSPSQSVFLVTSRQGQTLMKQGDLSLTLNPGDVTLVDPNLPWDFAFEGEFTHLSVIIPRSFMALHPKGQDAAVLWQCRSETRLARAMNAILDLLQSHAGDHDPDVGLKDALFALIAAGLASSSDDITETTKYAAAKTFQRARIYIEEYLSDPNLSPTTLAIDLGLSLRTVHRLFQQHGTTVSSYIMHKRLERCHDYLTSHTHRNRSITDIAFEWGFNDHAYFSRSFRRHFGVTPNSIRPR